MRSDAHRDGAREARMAQVPARWAVVSALLALGFGGCKAGGGTTDPSAEARRPPTSVQTWAGSFKFSSEIQGRISGTTTFEGSATWQKEQAPDPASPPIRAGAVRYRVASGQGAVGSWRGGGLAGVGEV